MLIRLYIYLLVVFVSFPRVYYVQGHEYISMLVFENHYYFVLHI